MQKISKYKTAHSYALAWFEAAKDAKCEDNVFAEVQMLYDVVCTDDVLWRNFSKDTEKSNVQTLVINEVSKKAHFSNITTETLKIIAENKRLSLLNLMLEEFEHLYYQDKDIVEVEVDTAVALSKTQENKLKKVLQKKMNKDVILHYHLKPEVLGGLAVKFNSFQIDDTLAHKLRLIKDLILNKKAC